MKFTANDYGNEATLAYNRAFTARVYELARHHARLAAEWPETRIDEWERLRRYREHQEAQI